MVLHGAIGCRPGRERNPTVVLSATSQVAFRPPAVPCPHEAPPDPPRCRTCGPRDRRRVARARGGAIDVARRTRQLREGEEGKGREGPDHGQRNCRILHRRRREDDVHAAERRDHVHARGGAVVVLRHGPSAAPARRRLGHDRGCQGCGLERGRRRNRQRHGAARGRQAGVGRRLEAGRRGPPGVEPRRRPTGSRPSSAIASRPASARRSRTAADPRRTREPTPTDAPASASPTSDDR